MVQTDIKQIADLLGKEITELPWFNYDLGGKFGGKLNINADTFKKTHGTIRTHNLPLTKIFNKLLNYDFSGIAFLDVGILAFFANEILKKINFVENGSDTVAHILTNYECNVRFKDDLNKIVQMDFDFEDFLLEASKNKNTFFDYDSAISVYKLQGDDAIFGILCQCFWVNRYCDCFCVKLIDYLPISLPIHISDWLSGCNFPVVVSPYSKNIKWGKNQNGWFLYQKIDEKWLVLDCVGTNFTTLGDKILANRLNFLGGGGEVVPFVICNNWGEIIEAVSFFGVDLLIRDLRNTIFNHYWFIFGKNSKFNVKYIKNGIWGTSKDYKILIQYDEVSNHRNGLGITIDLEKNFINFCNDKDIVFNASEAYDWCEIGEICKTLWK